MKTNKADKGCAVTAVAAVLGVIALGAASLVVGVGLVSFGWHAGAIIAGALLC